MGVDQYVAARLDYFKSLCNRYEELREERLDEADAIWAQLPDADKREAERGYFAEVQKFNRGDPNYKGPRQL